MPPLVIPPLVKLLLGAAGTAAMAHWVIREMRRITAALDRDRMHETARAAGRESLPTLRRDERGEWRLDG